MDNRVTPDLRSYAHIGDAVWEVFVREIIIYQTLVPNELHKRNIALVNAEFQAELLEKLTPHLTEEELALAKRARNLSDGRSNRPAHRLSTAFEALIGYWHINDKSRIESIFEVIKTLL